MPFPRITNHQQPPLGEGMSYYLWVALGCPLFCWICFAAFVVFAQRRVIFSPPRAKRALEPGPWRASFRVVQEKFDAGGVLLEGWRSVLEDGVEKRGVAFYFGGRSEDVCWAPQMSSYLLGWEIVAFNYRGFGGSGGRATERHVVDDAMAIYEAYQSHFDLDSGHQSAVIGRSLGSGVAVQLATEKLPAKLVLISPYASLASVAATRWFLLPAILFIRHRFESIKYAPAYEGEALIFVAPGDTEVPAKHSRRLAAAFRAPTSVEEIAGEHHKTLPRNADLQRRLSAFLACAEPY